MTLQAEIFINHFWTAQIFFHLTWNRVIAAVRTNWKIRQGVLIFAISCSTFKVREAVVIIRTMSFFYSTLTSALRRTAWPCLCISGSRPITTNWIIYKECNLKIKNSKNWYVLIVIILCWDWKINDLPLLILI